jgi:Na+/proline symporter
VGILDFLGWIAGFKSVAFTDGIRDALMVGFVGVIVTIIDDYVGG